MANCHFSFEQNQTQIAGAITDLEGNILFSNRPYSNSFIADPIFGEDAEPDPVKGEWLLSGCKVYITRFWASSKATVVLT
ncbi:MAG: hypothetical protein ABEK59_12810, partial [Halobacteria archaeon]